VTQNVSREESFHYLLILEETPEKIKMVEDMITKIDAPTRNEYEPEYQTVID
jgi:predicted phosphatase